LSGKGEKNNIENDLPSIRSRSGQI